MSVDSLTLDRWGDSATISAQPVDQFGNDLNGASIVWSSADDTIAAVDNSGNVTTWLGGGAELTVEASLDGTTVSDTAAVTVAIQQNINCTVPTEFPMQGPVAPPGDWIAENADTGFDQGSPDDGLAFDMDLDGDNDLVLAHNFGRRDSPNEGEPPGFVQRVWLNDGTGQFTDGTQSMLGGDNLLELGTWLVLYRDFSGDGHLDALALNSGIETIEDCGSGPTACLGFPNTLLVPQPGAGVADLAPSNLIPYETDGTTFGGDAADIDCDGDEDIFLASQGGYPVGFPPHMFVNNGSGILIAQDQRIPQDLNSLNGTIDDGAFCDLDRDGDRDLLLNGGGDDTLKTWVLVNDGFGNFRDSLVQLPETPKAKFSLYCTDIDLNGFPDPVISNECNEFPDCDPPAGLDVQVQVFLNHGELSFTDSTGSLLPPDTDKPYRDQGLRDFNGDGWPDMLVPDPGGPNVLWNTGGGLFTKRYLPGGFGFGGAGVVVADFDGDGRPDIHLDRFNWQGQLQNVIWWNREGQSCDLPPGGVWAPEARDCTTEDCNSDGRWHSWDGKLWCRALITQEFQSWMVTVPPGKTVFDFWADWGAWDLNDCGDGQASISIATCGLDVELTRGGEEQELSCDVTGETSVLIEKPNAGICDYVIIGDPIFR